MPPELAAYFLLGLNCSLAIVEALDKSLKPAVNSLLAIKEAKIDMSHLYPESWFRGSILLWIDIFNNPNIPNYKNYVWSPFNFFTKNRHCIKEVIQIDWGVVLTPKDAT